MVMTKHTRDGALEVLRGGLFGGAIGYTDKNGTVGVIAQDEAIGYLIDEDYSERYAKRVLSNAFTRGQAHRLARGLYLLHIKSTSN